MGDTTQTSSSTTGTSNKALQGTISKLATGLGNEYTPGKSLYQDPGATTVAGQNAALTAAGNPAYAAGITGALDNLSGVARGDYLGNTDPNFQAALDRATNGTAADINAAIGANGRYGSNVHVNALTDAIGGMRSNAELGNLHYEQQRQQNAISQLPGLFSAGQLPSSVQQSVGASQDAAAAAKAAGPTDFLAKLSAIVNGTAGAAGTTTTSTQPGTPLWQILLGGGLGLAGLA